MSTLTEVAEWVDGIYQIEQTDSVLGGPPNEATGAGLSNIPAQQLAKRTMYLKTKIEGGGIGKEALASITDFNAVTAGGLYRAGVGAGNAPQAGASFTLIHMPTADTTAAVQTAYGSATDRVFWRRKTANVWGAWREVWTGAQPSVQLAGAGYQVLPSGLILQWGTIGNAAHGSSVTFPMTFPAACYGVVLGDIAVDITPAAAHILSVSSRTSSGFTMSIVRHDADVSTTTGFTYLALGV